MKQPTVYSWRTQFSCFAVVGLAATLTTYGVLILGVEVVGWDAVSASVAGYLVGIAVNYTLNYRFTFKSYQPHPVALPRFVAVMLFGMALNGAVMYAGVYWLSMHYILAQLLAVSGVLLWSFAANRFWTFAQTDFSARHSTPKEPWNRTPTR